MLDAKKCGECEIDGYMMVKYMAHGDDEWGGVRGLRPNPVNRKGKMNRKTVKKNISKERERKRNNTPLRPTSIDGIAHTNSASQPHALLKGMLAMIAPQHLSTHNAKRHARSI